MHRLLRIVFTCLLFPAVVSATPPASTSDPVDVYVSGEGGYHTYRIPAIIRCTDGSLLAFAEGRKDGQGDSGNIDLLQRRSTDGGVTWSDTLRTEFSLFWAKMGANGNSLLSASHP